MRLLENLGIVIIGGTTGMGLAITEACINAGARVVVTGKTLSEEIEHLQAKELPVRQIQSDARREGSAEQAIEMLRNEFGHLDALFHVAGGSGRSMGDGPLHELTLDGWNQTIELNLSSAMLSARAAVDCLRRQGSGGSIVLMGSALAFHPSPRFFGTIAYATAKAALAGFCRSAAACYAPDNIRINVLAPALVETPMSARAAADPGIMEYIRTKQPLDGGRIGRPEDISGLAVFLMSAQARHVTGQVIHADGGWSVSEGQLPHNNT